LNNELLKFESKEIDVLNVRGNSVARFKELDKKGNYTIYNLGANTGTIFVTFNLNKRKNKAGQYYVPKYKQKWFNDLNFRTAVDYAIDRETIVSNILYGVGQELFTAEGLSSIYLNKKIAKGHQRDVEKAKKLLLKSGFFYDKNGNLYDKDKNRVEFNLFTNAGNTEREAIGVMLKQDLADVGIKVNFKPIEYNSLVGKMMDTYDWDSIIIGLTGSPLEPHGGKNVWASNGTMHLFNMRKTKADMSDVEPWETELDSVFDKGAREIDFHRRKAYYDRYQQIIYEQKPIIYLYSPMIIIAIRNKFGNLNPTPLGGSFHNLEEIYVK
jgi:peptide/nickel transport system substrate-binding protein